MSQEKIRTDHPIEDILKVAADRTDGDTVTLGDILSLFGDRSFGPVFTLLGLLCVIPPLGGIPGLPATVGAIILLFSLQMVFGRRHVWLPAFLKNLSVEKSKLEKAHEKTQETASKIDVLITPRLSWSVFWPF